MSTVAPTMFAERVFKWRGHMPIPFALLGFGLMCWQGPQFPVAWQPLVLSAAVSLIIFGHVLRYWALGHIGDTTRSVRLQAPYLATGGPYGHVRNPLYLANCLIGIGCALYLQQPCLLVLYPLLFWFQYGLIIPLEEQFLQQCFGTTYECYARQVRRYWPRLSPYPGAPRDFDWSVLQSKEYFALLGSVTILALTHLALCAHRGWFAA